MLKIKHHRGECIVNLCENLESCLIDLKKKHKDSILISDIYFESSLKNHFKYSFFISADESSKQILSVINLLDEILKCDEDGKLPINIISIGGGIIQDISGFIAGIIKRGINWIYIPSTFAAQADSCVGSKISINVGTFKNQIGFFYSPSKIFLIPDLIKSLSEKDYWCGVGEALHYFLQTPNEENVDLFRLSVEELSSTNKLSSKTVSKITTSSINIKGKFITADEFDTNLRKNLNLGHTFGHAIETASKNKIPHGLAVLIGCYLAINYPIKNSYMKILEKYNNELKKALVLTRKFWNHHIDNKLLSEALKKDKKNTNADYVNLILPSERLANDSYPSIMKITPIPLRDVYEYVIKFFSEF